MFRTYMPTGNPISLPVTASEVFEAGIIGELDPTTAKIVRATGYRPLGFLDGWKTTAVTRKIVDEAVVMTGTDNVPLKHANLTADAVKVTSSDGLTVYEETTDYDVNDTNGTIVRVGSDIGDGDTVLVSYEYTLSATEAAIYRASAPTGNDDTAGSGMVAVHFAQGLYWTDQYDIVQVYQTMQVLYAVDGVLTNSSSGLSGTPPKCGRVMRVPSGGLGTAAVPYPEMMLVELMIELP